ncbi:MAG: helix-turn-helix domain-containing protein [Mangrovibacterium sp.]
MEKFFTLEEMGELLKIPVQTLRIHQKEFENHKLGRKILVSESSIEKWLESRRRKPTQKFQKA